MGFNRPQSNPELHQPDPKPTPIDPIVAVAVAVAVRIWVSFFVCRSLSGAVANAVCSDTKGNNNFVHFESGLQGVAPSMPTLLRNGGMQAWRGLVLLTRCAPRLEPQGKKQQQPARSPGPRSPKKETTTTKTSWRSPQLPRECHP